MAVAKPKPRFFRTQPAFREWLRKNHEKQAELWVGYYKKASGKGGMVYKEALDEALCFGWIDGIVKSIDGDTYMQRYTPRKKNSHWSLVNVRRFGELDAAGLVEAAGRAAFERKTPERTGQTSYESGPVELTAPQLKTLKANRKAWEHFQKMSHRYQHAVKHWITTAKKESTREERLLQLITHGAKGELIPRFLPRGKQ